MGGSGWSLGGIPPYLVDSELLRIRRCENRGKSLGKTERSVFKKQTNSLIGFVNEPTF